MFTGLVEFKGTIKSSVSDSNGARFVISSNFDDLKIGDSICVNGVCHTIVKITDKCFEIETMNETLKCTNIGNLKKGDFVNLERSMPADGRFGGHIVSGHTDGVAKLISITKDGFSLVYRFSYPERSIVYKGSVCVNGVSLTVSATGENYFEVSLIPHTLNNTNLGDLNAGDIVNIEIDIFAKYIEKFMNAKSAKNTESNIDEKFLTENGF